MFTRSYDSVINHLGEVSPTLDKPTQFIEWAEQVAELTAFIYGKDYDTVTEDIVNSAKEVQNYEDED